ncbi:unnamed protein product [Spirodela intermedia]|uniref:Uncharacterized protein n=1 Tax=Spirodela intermedia TaxID=51605 RepID=A0A7I8IYT4_SPIIN|nr:unnamed protein product [Spirodela intermedia]CAA6662182.1 unnamed protein product [Spirodela intermedia]
MPVEPDGGRLGGPAGRVAAPMVRSQAAETVRPALTGIISGKPFQDNRD